MAQWGACGGEVGGGVQGSGGEMVVAPRGGLAVAGDGGLDHGEAGEAGQQHRVFGGALRPREPAEGRG